MGLLLGAAFAGLSYRLIDLQVLRHAYLTAKAQESDVRAGADAGADLYLTKPFSPLELLTAVEEALGLNA